MAGWRTSEHEPTLMHDLSGYHLVTLETSAMWAGASLNCECTTALAIESISYRKTSV